MREEGAGDNLTLVATLSPAAQKEIQDNALKQNITTLHNRVNELGVAEPVIQQQGADRIVVQLPGVQDVARAKQILGRTATLEIRMVDQEAMAAGQPGALDRAGAQGGRHRAAGPAEARSRRHRQPAERRLARPSTRTSARRCRCALDEAGGRAMRASRATTSAS